MHCASWATPEWSITGGNLRPDMLDTIAALQAQGGAYTLETITPQGERSYTRIESIQRVIPYQEDLAPLIAVGADPATRIISFTVTEAGYYLDANDQLDWSNYPDLRADLDAVKQGRTGHTIYGGLVSILRARMQANAGPVTLMNCDNLRHNGERSRGGLLQFIDALGDSTLKQWVQAHTSSPNAMVDRITPRPTPDVAERVKAATGWDDHAAVMGESFIQWVIEDHFVAGRPAWDKVGVEMVASVDAYEEAKIRLLNATHSCIAWAGTLVGYQYIHEGTHDAVIRGIAYDYVTDDTIPVLDTPEKPSPWIWPPTAMWCWTALATRPFATPTSASPWTATPKFRVSLPRRFANVWRVVSRSPVLPCCPPYFWPICSAGTRASLPTTTKTKRWTRQSPMPSVRLPTRSPLLRRTRCCGGRWPRNRPWCMPFGRPTTVCAPWWIVRMHQCHERGLHG